MFPMVFNGHTCRGRREALFLQQMAVRQMTVRSLSSAAWWCLTTFVEHELFPTEHDRSGTSDWQTSQRPQRRLSHRLLREELGHIVVAVSAANSTGPPSLALARALNAMREDMRGMRVLT